MKIKDQFRFVLQNLKKNKVRTGMTILATAMGCAFLIVLASVGYGLQESIIKETLEQQIVTEIDIHGHLEKDGNYRSLTMEDIDYLESIDNVNAVTRKNQLRQFPTFSLDEYGSETTAVSAHFPSEVDAGLELDKGRLPEKPNEVVVGYHFLDYFVQDVKGEDIYDEASGEIKGEYLYQDNLIGQTLNMTVKRNLEVDGEEKAVPLTVVGILKKPTKDWIQDQNVYISGEVFTDVEAYTGAPGGELGVDGDQLDSATLNAFDEVKVYATNLEAVQVIVDELDDANYASYSVVSEMKQINMLFTIMKAGLILIGTIAILIASIGIYNTMTMAVTERAPDIGIMKAIGANPKTIKQIFLLESSYIGIVGAFIGTLVAYVVSSLVNIGLPIIIEFAFQEELPEQLQFSMIPVSLVLISVGICLLVTILSGLRPANRATKIDVLMAMRREI
ncbi:FtsX-like permease family protein [Oceanobacillus sp. FSL K6-2867]|uniref:ABC transporter permease n=1 Tax=Oceanobacillus sp. FSL K6-2867 TaxID=2954748 RepID=UPI0030DBBACB